MLLKINPQDKKRSDAPGLGGVTPDTALRLARYFKTTPQFWMNLQASYDLKTALRDSKGRIEKEVLPYVA